LMFSAIAKSIQSLRFSVEKPRLRRRIASVSGSRLLSRVTLL